MVNSIQLQFLNKQKKTLTENIEEISKQMSYSLSDLAKYKDLKRQSKEYFEILKNVDNEIKLLGSQIDSSVKPEQKLIFSSQSLSKIDFNIAEETVNFILENCLGEQGGLALFLLPNASSMRGDLCVEKIKYSLSSNSYGNLKYCPIDPLLRPDISDERSLLDAIADYFKPIETHPDDKQYVQNIIKKIGASLYGGSIVFFDFSNWDSITENDDRLLSWFIKYFWNSLKQKHKEISNEYSKVKLILFISISSAITESYTQLIYCDNYEDNFESIKNLFNSQKFLCLHLENWKKSDIDYWLQSEVRLPRSKSEEIAKKIYKLSNDGIPVIVCSKFEESLAQLLKA